ncbi:MAG: PEP/pyruvate-binding domain-containing protein [bacterium]|nr:PEP/pyruvate-binding domain-containing protein [bacterium]
MPHAPYSTGLPNLDQLLHGVFAGDNFVWEIDDSAQYGRFVRPLATYARAHGIHIEYMRFADHPPLLSPADDIHMHELDPTVGFEKFVTETVNIIERTSTDSWYVFDTLSGLAEAWYSDRMLANFFLVVCPYVLRTESLAYFALIRKQHSNHATDSIYATAQVIADVYEYAGRIYLQPQKVDQRHSPTMYMMHEWRGEQFVPVTNSAIIADVITSETKPLMNFTIQRYGPWIRSFHEAKACQAAVARGEKPAHELQPHREHLLRMLITRDKPFIALARRYFSLDDLIAIMQRMIGSGLIGGKARGMLLAQKILRAANPAWERILEPHDSFYIGSDVFYTYIIQNDCWWLRRKSGSISDMLERAAIARERIMKGTFLDYIEDQFMEMLDYFGQSPIIVRSSSLLEDSYGNAFSGKYESVFLANQGTPEERFAQFLHAVRTVYASTMSEEALLYRVHHGLLNEDEQMALLVQRVSGDQYGRWFFPAAAGVGFSYNPYVWNEEIDPQAGVLRLVCGLGTHAVERVEDDYTRIVALNAPTQRPEGSAAAARKYTQHALDVLDLEENTLVTRHVREIFPVLPPRVRELLASLDEEQARRAEELQLRGVEPWELTFARLFGETDFIPTMRTMLALLQETYESPVDIEFTVNFPEEGGYRINLVQCRPFQVRIGGSGELGHVPAQLPPENVVFETHGPIVGQSLATPIDRVVFVVPAAYARLREQERYAIARVIGRLTHLPSQGAPPTIMLLGPGRWGTSMPSMGVPVSFKEINTVSVIGELALMHEGLVPEVSLGTHFFNDLVEMNMIYLAVFPEHEGTTLNETFLMQRENRLGALLPEDAMWEHVVRVLDFGRPDSDYQLHLHVDSLRQRAVCYVRPISAV